MWKKFVFILAVAADLEQTGLLPNLGTPRARRYLTGRQRSERAALRQDSGTGRRALRFIQAGRSPQTRSRNARSSGARSARAPRRVSPAPEGSDAGP